MKYLRFCTMVFGWIILNIANRDQLVSFLRNITQRQAETVKIDFVHQNAIQGYWRVFYNDLSQNTRNSHEGYGYELMQESEFGFNRNNERK